MKAITIAMAALVALLFVSTELVQARYGDFVYCKSGAKVQNASACKENGGKR
jgi:hypothetical protein